MTAPTVITPGTANNRRARRSSGKKNSSGAGAMRKLFAAMKWDIADVGDHDAKAFTSAAYKLYHAGKLKRVEAMLLGCKL